MRGTGAVAIGGAVVYGYFTTDGPTARLRVSADDCDRLDLFAGRQVRITLPGRTPANALVTAVDAQPPFAWVEVEVSATAPATA